MQIKDDEYHLLLEPSERNPTDLSVLKQEVEENIEENRQLFAALDEFDLNKTEKRLHQNLLSKFETLQTYHDDFFSFLEQNKMDEARTVWVEMQKKQQNGHGRFKRMAFNHHGRTETYPF